MFQSFECAHVWSFSVRRATRHVRGEEGALSAEERARIDDFVVRDAAAQYATGRVLLRSVLGAYSGRAPSDVSIVIGQYGRPECPSDGLRFNLSHSDDCLMIAVSVGGAVGVDVERVRAIDAAESLASRHFHPDESRDIATLSEASERSLAFLRCWVRKEAYLKGVGVGLHGALDDFRVPVEPAPVSWVRRRGDAEATASWRVLDVEPCAGYVGALAVESSCVAPSALASGDWKYLQSLTTGSA